MSSRPLRDCSNIDCYTVWRPYDCQQGTRHCPQLAAITLLWLAGLNIGWGIPLLQSTMMNSELTWPVEISTVFQRPLTVPLYSPDDYARRLWESLCPGGMLPGSILAPITQSPGKPSRTREPVGCCNVRYPSKTHLKSHFLWNFICP